MSRTLLVYVQDPQAQTPESLEEWLEKNLEAISPEGNFHLAGEPVMVLDPSAVLTQMEQEPPENDGGLPALPEDAQRWLEDHANVLLYFSL